MAVFQELWRAGITVILVTHEPDIAAYAERVVNMRDGRIVSDRRQEPTPAVPAPSSSKAGAHP
jgi:putative ABC transport system ATP-binding protein